MKCKYKLHPVLIRNQPELFRWIVFVVETIREIGNIFPFVQSGDSRWFCACAMNVLRIIVISLYFFASPPFWIIRMLHLFSDLFRFLTLLDTVSLSSFFLSLIPWRIRSIFSTNLISSLLELILSLKFIFFFKLYEIIILLPRSELIVEDIIDSFGGI